MKSARFSSRTWLLNTHATETPRVTIFRKFIFLLKARPDPLPRSNQRPPNQFERFHGQQSVCFGGLLDMNNNLSLKLRPDEIRPSACSLRSTGEL